MCTNLSGGLLWISINSQSYKWGATLDLVKIEILESRGYFGSGGGLLWRGATLDRSSLTVQTVCIYLNGKYLIVNQIFRRIVNCLGNKFLATEILAGNEA